jgi:hypothetical protein
MNKNPFKRTATAALAGLMLASAIPSYAIASQCPSYEPNARGAECQAADDEASYANTSYGFFKSIGDERAADMALNPEKYGATDTHTSLTDDNDATCLDAMLIALDRLEELSDRRKAAGYSELRVCSDLMATSQLAGNYSAHTFGHAVWEDADPTFPRGAECLEYSWPSADPWDGWYSEKNYLDEATMATAGVVFTDDREALSYYNSHYVEIRAYLDGKYGTAYQLGHYFNLFIEIGDPLAGMAFNNSGVWEYQYYPNPRGADSVYDDGSITGDIYTIPEYKALLESYIASIGYESPHSWSSLYAGDGGSEPDADSGSDQGPDSIQAEDGYGDCRSAFADWSDGEWWSPGVAFCYRNGLITGYAWGSDAGKFGVGESMTRAEFATVLWRNACPAEAAAYDSIAENETGMPDVVTNGYYTAAANWAVANGIINGSEEADGRHFNPDDPITLEQMVAILANPCSNGAADSADTSTLSGFTDGASVSDWARASVAWGKGVGLVNGYADGLGEGFSLRPQENVARERVATILMNAFDAGVMTSGAE